MTNIRKSGNGIEEAGATGRRTAMHPLDSLAMYTLSDHRARVDREVRERSLVRSILDRRARPAPPRAAKTRPAAPCPDAARSGLRA
jgi:hypothetical protein